MKKMKKKKMKKKMRKKNKILMEFPLKLQIRVLLCYYCDLFQISDHVPFVDTLA